MADPNPLYTGYNRSNLEKARRLRKEMTKQERHLWHDFLKTYPVRFYRQRPIDRYIVDFYCHEARLVVELDGDQHGENSAAEYDRQRTECLRGLGLEVIRFANGDMSGSFDGVCRALHNKVKDRLHLFGKEENVAVLEALEQTWGF